MIKNILLIFLLSTLLLGSDIQDELLRSKYEKGLAAYKSKDFKQSYDVFSKLYLTKLSDAKFNFYLGRSAFETGHYEIALASFERVEMLDPSNLRNKLEMARTYFMLKMYEDSELAFKEVLDNPNIPQNVRTNIEMYLSRVKGVQSKSFTYATLTLDWIYDSNVNFGSLDTNYNVHVGGSLLPISSKEQVDTALQVFADLVNIYDIGDKNGFMIKNRLKVFLKDYDTLNDYDVQFLAYNPSLLYRETKFLGELVLGVDVLTLAKKEYLRSFSVTPRFEYSHTNTLRSLTHFKFQDKSYTQKSQEDLDAKHYELAYGMQKILSPRSYVSANIRGIMERKDHGSRIDVDYDEYRLNLSYANQFTAIYGVDMFGEYRMRDYADYSSLFKSTRADKSANVAATLNAKILSTLRFHLKGNYEKVSSNQERYDYVKYTISLGLNKTF